MLGQAHRAGTRALRPSRSYRASSRCTATPSLLRTYPARTACTRACRDSPDVRKEGEGEHECKQGVAGLEVWGGMPGSCRARSSGTTSGQ